MNNISTKQNVEEIVTMKEYLVLTALHSPISRVTCKKDLTFNYRSPMSVNILDNSST